MKLRTLVVLVVSLCLVTMVSAQIRAVKIVKLEVDGKEVSGDFKLYFQVDARSIELVKNGNSFVVPAEVKNAESVDVRLTSGKYELNFEAVPVSKFAADWTFGIDTNPYDEANLSIETPPDPPGVELAGIHYLQFVSKEGTTTRQITKVYKQASQ